MNQKEAQKFIGGKFTLYACINGRDPSNKNELVNSSLAK